MDFLLAAFEELEILANFMVDVVWNKEIVKKLFLLSAKRFYVDRLAAKKLFEADDALVLIIIFFSLSLVRSKQIIDAVNLLGFLQQIRDFMVDTFHLFNNKIKLMLEVCPFLISKTKLLFNLLDSFVFHNCLHISIKILELLFLVFLNTLQNIFNNEMVLINL